VVDWAGAGEGDLHSCDGGFVWTGGGVPLCGCRSVGVGDVDVESRVEVIAAPAGILAAKTGAGLLG
jgi:hypothetical protein